MISGNAISASQLLTVADEFRIRRWLREILLSRSGREGLARFPEPGHAFQGVVAGTPSLLPKLQILKLRRTGVKQSPCLVPEERSQTKPGSPTLTSRPANTFV